MSAKKEEEIQKLNYFDLAVFLSKLREHYTKGRDSARHKGNSWSVYRVLIEMGRKDITEVTVGTLRNRDDVPDHMWKEIIAEPWIEDLKQGVQRIRAEYLATNPYGKTELL